jgi:hypothetical protein
MEPRSGRGWFWAAMAVVLLLIVVWVAAAIQLSIASAGEGGFNLASQLRADYSTEPLGRPVRLLSFSIIQDVLQDLGMAPDKAAAESNTMELAMSSPVPTATARDFQGAAPYTATPTKTRAPTRTPRPTITSSVTPSNTPRSTRTATTEPTSTKKPKPTKVEKSKTPEPTATLGGEDNETPYLDTSDMVLNPHDGATLDCSDSITVTHLVLIDPAPSDGIDFLKLKYKISDGHHTYVMGSDLTPVSSGYDAEGNWVAVYNGTIDVDFDEAWAQTSLILGRAKLAILIPFTDGSYKVDLDVYYGDNAHHSAHPLIAEYFFPASCGD